MAFTLRLSDDEQRVLTAQAERMGLSQNEIVRVALREYIERQSKAELLAQVMDSELPPFAEALERLGQ